MNVLVGTSGFAFKEWKGPFYPEDLKDDAMLGYYSGKYPTVEDVRDDVAKVPAPRKKTGRKGQSFDQEKIALAKEAYPNKKFVPRPRPAIMETLGMLVTRDQRNSTDKTKYQIQAIEYILGIRDSL